MNILTREISVTAVSIAAIAIAPLLCSTFTLMQLTLFAAMSVLSLSLGLIWGLAGILSFGQAALFGLGGYAYAIAVINLGESTGAILLAVLVPALFAAALGYFIFYGKITDVYVGVITLTVTLILFNLINSTAGEGYKIGVAALGGFNGIPAVPPFNVPFDPSSPLDPVQTWYVTGGILAAVYILLRVFLKTRFGRVVVAVRENEMRAGLLGYDTRLVKLAVFVLGGAISGLAGALYANWGGFVSPTIFSLSLSAEIIIWVTLGGVGTLIGPIIGCFIIQYLVSKIGAQQTFNSNLVLGAILIVCVRVLPTGLVPVGSKLIASMRKGSSRKSSSNAAINQGLRP